MSMIQRKRILQHLQEFGSCTAGGLMVMYGIGSPRKRLSELSRSAELQLLGLELASERVEGVNRYGEPVTFKRYFLVNREDKKGDTNDEQI